MHCEARRVPHFTGARTRCFEVFGNAEGIDEDSATDDFGFGVMWSEGNSKFHEGVGVDFVQVEKENNGVSEEEVDVR